MKVVKALLVTIFWMFPYLMSGIAAPFVFKYAPTRVMGGHIAGVLFMISVFWALTLSWRHFYMGLAKLLIMIFFALAVMFWSWRFTNTMPLEQAVLAGFPGPLWHSILTTLWSGCALVIFILEFRWHWRHR